MVDGCTIAWLFILTMFAKTALLSHFYTKGDTMLGQISMQYTKEVSLDIPSDVLVSIPNYHVERYAKIVGDVIS